MSHIYVKGNRWYITFFLSGHQHHFSLRIPAATPRRQVLRLQARIDYEMALGRFDPEALKGKKTLETTLHEFLYQVKEYYIKHKRKFSPRTLDDYFYSIELLKRIIIDLPLSRLNQELADREVMAYLYENYSHASVRHHAGNFRSFFSLALKWKFLDENPFRGLVPRRQRRIPQYYSREEVEAMRSHFKERPPWQGDMIFLALNTGLRKGELLGLDWDRHVDLEAQQLKFPGKGGRERFVPLNVQAMNILKKRARHIKKTRVFWEPKNRYAVDSAWKHFRAKTKIVGSFHQLRRTYASYYMMAGGKLADLQEILGHEDPATVRIYAALSPEHLQKNKDLVGF